MSIDAHCRRRADAMTSIAQTLLHSRAASRVANGCEPVPSDFDDIIDVVVRAATLISEITPQDNLRVQYLTVAELCRRECVDPNT